MSCIPHRSDGRPSRVTGVYNQTQLSDLDIDAGIDVNECYCPLEGASELSRSDETCNSQREVMLARLLITLRVQVRCLTSIHLWTGTWR